MGHLRRSDETWNVRLQTHEDIILIAHRIGVPGEF